MSHVVSLRWVCADDMQFQAISWGDLHDTQHDRYWRDRAVVPVLLVEYATWGDYGGDSASRANWQWLDDNGGRVVRDVGWNTGTGRSKILTLPGAVQTTLRAMDKPDGGDALEALREYLDGLPDWREDHNRRYLVEVIDELHDYPLIDDEVCSYVEDDIAREDFESWAWDDIRSAASGDGWGEHDEAIEADLDATEPGEVYGWIRCEWDETGYDWGTIETATGSHWNVDEIGQAIREFYLDHDETLPWSVKPDPDQLALNLDGVA